MKKLLSITILLSFISGVSMMNAVGNQTALDHVPGAKPGQGPKQGGLGDQKYSEHGYPHTPWWEELPPPGDDPSDPPPMTAP